MVVEYECLGEMKEDCVLKEIARRASAHCAKYEYISLHFNAFFFLLIQIHLVPPHSLKPWL